VTLGDPELDAMADEDLPTAVEEVLDMAFSLTWLPTVLLESGLKVAEQPGWKNRGRGDVGAIQGVMCHHTAGSRTGNMPSLGVLTKGRPDLSRSALSTGTRPRRHVFRHCGRPGQSCWTW
jgi:hypothetical protein